MGLSIMGIALLVYLAVVSECFRTLCLVILGLSAGGIWFLADFGSDKPQTIFYNQSAHPAFLMRAGDSCPGERHIWNGWCVK
jgi:hypothetical protein